MLRTYPNLFAFFRGEGRIQDQLAKELDISPGQLSMIKWGLRQPPLPLALRIADRCRVPLESLIRPRPAKAAKARPKLRRAVSKVS